MNMGSICDWVKLRENWGFVCLNLRNYVYDFIRVDWVL